MQAVGRTERKSAPGAEIFIVVILKFRSLVIKKNDIDVT